LPFLLLLLLILLRASELPESKSSYGAVAELEATRLETSLASECESSTTMMLHSKARKKVAKTEVSVWASWVRCSQQEPE
jgi:hypothetical protein